MLFFISACGIFSTRDPGDPAGPNSNDIAIFYDEVPELLVTSIETRDSQQYMALIDSAFTYIPPNGIENPAFFLSWDYDAEDVFIRRMLSLDVLPIDSAATISFSSAEITENAADTVIYQQNYSLSYHSVQEGLPQVYEGVLQWYLVRGSDGGWRIRIWQDDTAGDEATMSTLRLTL